jgi:lipoprotein-releasing system ATP-binding protein
MTEPAKLRVTDLRKTYPSPGGDLHVLDGVTLDLDPGGSLAIMGPSGSGKSTLLHILGALDVPTGGRVELGGIDPFSLGPSAIAAFRNRSVGFVFQDHYLLPQLTVLENVLVPTLVADGALAAPEAWARELLERVGLSPRAGHRPAELSGGERQRAAIARALVNRPALLLCDEPTGNLDADSARAVSGLFLDLHRELRNILIVVTHSPELASCFQEIRDLRRGRLENVPRGAAG